MENYQFKSSTYECRKGLKFDLEWIGDINYLQLLIEKVDKHYIKRESIAKNFGLCNSIDYKNSIKQDIANALHKNLVLVARYQGDIVGCSVNNNYLDDILNAHNHILTAITSEDMKIFSAFCNQLEDPFIKEISPVGKKDIFYANFVYVEESYVGNGLSLKLIEEFSNKAYSLNYKYIMVLLTSKLIQNTFFRKFNYELKNELHFRDFEYKGRKPFFLIKDAASCIVAIKRLNT